MTILNIHAGSLPSFALRLKSADTLTTLRQRAAAKVRLQLSDGIPLAVKYGWNGQRYSLEDDDDWEIFVERVSNQPEADGECGGGAAGDCERTLSLTRVVVVVLPSLPHFARDSRRG